jgi:Spy/CpxP family protein refolding chaperone
MQRGWRSAAVALVATMVLTSGALAQRGGGGGFGGRGGGINMLRMPEVQTELKLTADQKTKVETLLEQRRGQGGGGQGFRDLSPEERQKAMAERRAEENKQLGAILNADQMKRYNQLRLQRTGMTALAETEVATELSLTADQKTKIQEIVQQANNERRSLFQDGGGGGDREAMRAKMEELQKATDTKLAAVLTDAQKTKWKELVGAPFTFPAPGNFRAVS